MIEINRHLKMTASTVNKVKTSLLVLTQTLDELKPNLKGIIEESFKYTNEHLYVYFNPIQQTKSFPTVKTSFEPELITDRLKFRSILSSFYQKSFKINPKINVTCLLNNIHASRAFSNKTRLNYDIILTDLITSSPIYSKILSFCSTNLPNDKLPDSGMKIQSIKTPTINEISFHIENQDHNNDQIYLNQVYKNTIMGGTFDRLHIGHKIMLSEAVLLTENRLLIGVTTESMLTRKKLAELIESYHIRVANLQFFLNKVASGLNVSIVGISDPFGPSIVEKDYQCLVVSKETLKSGELVNAKRVENGLARLEIHAVELIEDLNVDAGDEEKVSSSNQRRRLLGTLLKRPYFCYDPSKPYIIGLTGGLASGKSTIASDLEKLGAGNINCDLLGHLAYEKDTDAYKKILQTFGSDILDTDQLIDRKRLGAKVFNSQSELKKLTDIVWPEIQVLVNKQVEVLFSQGYRIIVVEAALLLEASWHKNMNEIWVCFVPDEEAIERAVKRDGASVEKAIGILRSQFSNKEKIASANVVFSSLWEREYTLGQVKKAWKGLVDRTVGSLAVSSSL